MDLIGEITESKAVQVNPTLYAAHWQTVTEKH